MQQPRRSDAARPCPLLAWPGRVLRGGWLAVLLATALLAGPARAQDAASLTPAEARQALEVLQDAGRRRQVIEVLRAIAAAGPEEVAERAPAPATGGAAPPARTAPAAGAAAPAAETVSLTSDSLLGAIIASSSTWLSGLSGVLAAAGSVIGGAPLVWNWLARTATNPFAQTAVLDVAWRLVVVVGLAWALRWLLARALRRAVRALERRAEARRARRRAAPEVAPGIASRPERRLLHRAPLAALWLLLELVPLAGFAAAGNLLVTTPLGGAGGIAPLIILVAVNAFVVQQAAMAIGRAAVSPESRELRLFRLSDESAAYVEVWLGRITGVAIYGMAGLDVARLLGLYPAAYDSAAKLLILLNHLLLALVVMQCRHAVAVAIAPAGHASGTVAVLRHWFARIWHVVAIFLLIAVWFVWALRIDNGYALLLRYVGATVVVLVLARLAAVAVLGALDRVFRIGEETAQRLPSLAGRANRYVPILRHVVSGAIGVLAALALLQVWGLDVTGSFHDGGLGQRVAGSAVVLLVAAVLGVVIWEGVDSWMSRKIAGLTGSGEYARAARLRTLLPLLHSTLLVAIVLVVGFTALSQLGVNIAPLLAGAGIVGVAVGFGSQKLVQDVITGIFLLLENTMQVGDWVTVSGLSGSVENLSIRTIRLRAGDGSVHVIPFSSVSTVTNTNRGIGNAAVSVTVAFSEDPDRVGCVLKEIGAEMRRDPAFRDLILDDFALWGVDKVDGATFTVLGQMKCTDAGRWGVQREFNRRIKGRFQEMGIEIALPAQSVILSRAPRPGEAAEGHAAEDVVTGTASGAERHSPPPAALGNTQ